MEKIGSVYAHSDKSSNCQTVVAYLAMFGQRPVRVNEVANVAVGNAVQMYRGRRAMNYARASLDDLLAAWTDIIFEAQG